MYFQDLKKIFLLTMPFITVTVKQEELY